MAILKKIVFGAKEQLLAIDTFGQTIKLLAGIKKQDGIDVIKLLRQPIVNSIEATVKIILAKHNLHPSKIIMAIPYAKIFTAKVSVPTNLSWQEIATYCQFAAARQLKIAAEQIWIDFQIISTMPEQKVVAYYALNSEEGEEYVGWTKAFPSMPKIVDIDNFALERAMRNQYQNITEITTIINCNASAANLLVLDAKQIIYSSWLELFADNDSCESIVTRLTLALKCAHESIKQPVRHILMSGDCEFLLALAAAIRTNVNIPTDVVNPMQLNFRFNGGEEINNLAQFALCCGLALH